MPDLAALRPLLIRKNVMIFGPMTDVGVEEG